MARSPGTRATAIRLLVRILPADGAGESLRAALDSASPRSLPTAERGLLFDLCFGVCRQRRLLDAWLDAHMQKPLKASANLVRFVLLCGLYELWFSKRPSHAVVNAWPDVCRELRQDWAAGLVNALLRKAASAPLDDAWIASLAPAVRYSLPDWLWQQWTADWPEQALDMAEASLAAPPMTLRNNPLRQSRTDLIERLQTVGLAALPGSISRHSLYLQAATLVEMIPGFSEGSCSVQDEAAQIPASLLTPPAHGRILDACAAPGGKTGQLAEAWPDAGLTALEIDALRLRRVKANLDRLGLKADLLHGAAEQPATWWDGKPYDAILLDAPCSATGILRRQPDGKWHKRPADIQVLADLQKAMLDALWPLLKADGQLVYATCSVIKQENQHQIEAFLGRHANAIDSTPVFAENQCAGPGCQLLTTATRWDGFYFARLEKRAPDAV